MLSWRAFLTRRLTHAYFASRCGHESQVLVALSTLLFVPLSPCDWPHLLAGNPPAPPCPVPPTPRAYYHIQQRGDSTEALVLPPPTAKVLKGTTASPTSPTGGKASTGGGAGAAAGGAQGKAPHPPPGAAACATSSSPPAPPASSGLGGIDNPDQRICDDVAAFIRSSLALTLTLCRKIFNCVAFAGAGKGVTTSLVPRRCWLPSIAASMCAAFRRLSDFRDFAETIAHPSCPFNLLPFTHTLRRAVGRVGAPGAVHAGVRRRRHLRHHSHVRPRAVVPVLQVRGAAGVGGSGVGAAGTPVAS